MWAKVSSFQIPVSFKNYCYNLFEKFDKKKITFQWNMLLNACPSLAIYFSPWIIVRRGWAICLTKFCERKKKIYRKQEMENMPSNSSSMKQNKIKYNRKYLTNMPHIIAAMAANVWHGGADAITASPTTPIKTWVLMVFFFFCLFLIFYYKMKQNEMVSYRK